MKNIFRKVLFPVIFILGMGILGFIVLISVPVQPGSSEDAMLIAQLSASTATYLPNPTDFVPPTADPNKPTDKPYIQPVISETFDFVPDVPQDEK